MRTARKKKPKAVGRPWVKRIKRIESKQAQHTRGRTAQPLSGFPVVSYRLELQRYARLVIAPRRAAYSTDGELSAQRWMAAQRVAVAALNSRRMSGDVPAILAGMASRWAFRFDRLDAEALFTDIAYLHRLACERVLA